MKRKLIALAVASVFVAPAAMADTGNVTLYGVIDASFDATSTGNAAVGGNSTSTTKVSSSQSRIGFKGTEDVGGGTNAVWQIENGINTDGAAGTWASRNTFVGLSGESWGTLLLGNNDSPYKSSTRGMDAFADTIADNRNLMGIGRISFDGRNTNSVTYSTPDLGGLKIAAQYVAAAEGAVSQTQVKGSQYSLSGVYASGPLTGVLAYEVHDFGSAPGNAAAPGGIATSPAAANQKERATKIAGGYAVDQFSVNLVFEKTTDDINGATSLDHKTWYIAGKYNLSGTDTVKLAYAHAGNTGNPVGAGVQNGAKQISVGYDHAMSKRTKVYALWTRLANDDAAGSGGLYGLGGNPGATACVSTGCVANVGGGADPTAFSVGIKHSF